MFSSFFTVALPIPFSAKLVEYKTCNTPVQDVYLISALGYASAPTGPTKFSESSAYRYGRKMVPAPALDKVAGIQQSKLKLDKDGNRMLYHSEYGRFQTVTTFYIC